MRLTYLTLLGLLPLLACNTPKTVVAEPMEERQLETVVVSAPPLDAPVEETEEIPNDRPVYRASQERTSDLIHTSLDLRFDWEKEQVIGKATLTLQPIFYPISSVTLDAKGFQFNEIRMANERTPLKYSYEGDLLEVTIDLGREISRDEQYQLYIDYVATPVAIGGSEAITSDKGLFFINPQGEEDKPQQIWTQGETEHNSHWFPTLDQPNERCTQEMFLTVEDRFETLSNGLKVGTKDNGDGTHTDHWQMNLPHAPYLFMIAIGEFAVVEDDPWSGIPVNYYVEPEYEEHAEAIFPYTPEMLTFFSELTGVDYPWPKYSQVVVRDYVSGAMENTTGVIFGEFMNGTARELIDQDLNEKIVAHEMFHHWFGDLVTCESWSNLTLNEGFANYSEYLWLEHQHGEDIAEMHRIDELSGYLGSVRQGEPHELIWYDYDDKEQMFDAHSYNKGGLVLHLLRGYLGDELFFAGMEKYLVDNQFSAVEVDELRMAYEDLSGQDLQWFFDQWYLSAGHPELTIDYTYSVEAKEASVRVRQTQDTENNVPAIFRLPTTVAIHVAGQPTRYEEVIVAQRDQTFTFSMDSEPSLMVFDPEYRILGTRQDSYDEEDYSYLYEVGANGSARYDGLRNLDPSSAFAQTVFTRALSDPTHELRQVAMSRMNDPSPEALTVIRQIATADPHSGTRAQAIEMLTEAGDESLPAIAQAAVSDESLAFPIVGAGLGALATLDPAEGAAVAESLEGSDNPSIVGAIGAIYAAEGNPDRLPYFEEKLTSIDGQDAIGFYAAYAGFLSSSDEETMDAGLERMAAIGVDQGASPWQRISVGKTIGDMQGALMAEATMMEDGPGKTRAGLLIARLAGIFDTVVAAESIPQVKAIYEQFRPAPVEEATDSPEKED
ncbi:MAG: M1 family metallopeptidase [Bacteroidota bacterium]